ncbi:uncharacterized protein C2845_PM03G29310 [Panicum miliaceum]|uniref:Uncharacterized protein n=1 Tax=Panicum miliaceum TaxID=4540 RepID=A0A3L6T7R2_PANMI|nr:uncharacterized protein C2845_PM03G29310 [Panicum miliaceum]
MTNAGLPQMLRGKDSYWSGASLLERGCQSSKLEDLTLEEKKELFIVLEEKLEYPTNLSIVDRDKVIKSAMKEIASLQRRFKAHLRADFVRQDELPFEKHPFLKPEDWALFVETTNSPFFEQVSQEMKDKRAKHSKPHKMGRKGYYSKRKECCGASSSGKASPATALIPAAAPEADMEASIVARVGDRGPMEDVTDASNAMAARGGPWPL